MNEKFENNALSDDMLESVSGGSFPGYGPGEACPTCGGVLVDDGFVVGDRCRSKCTVCGETWWYIQNKRMAGYGPGKPCPTCGAILVDDNFSSGDSHRSRCPACGETWWYIYVD